MGTNVLLEWTKVYKTHLFHKDKVTYSTFYAVLAGFRSYTQTELIYEKLFGSLLFGIEHRKSIVKV